MADEHPLLRGSEILEIDQGPEQLAFLRLKRAVEGEPRQICVLLAHLLLLRVVLADPGLFLLEFIKVFSVDLAFQLWYLRSAAFSELLPVYPEEEGVGLNFLNAVHAQTLAWVCNQAPEEVYRRGAEVRFPGDYKCLAPAEDLLAGLRGHLREEGRVAHQHFVEYHSQRPPVNGFSVAGLPEHFWGDLVGRANSRIGQLPVALVLHLFADL